MQGSSQSALSKPLKQADEISLEELKLIATNNGSLTEKIESSELLAEFDPSPKNILRVSYYYLQDGDPIRATEFLAKHLLGAHLSGDSYFISQTRKEFFTSFLPFVFTKVEALTSLKLLLEITHPEKIKYNWRHNEAEIKQHLIIIINNTKHSDLICDYIITWYHHHIASAYFKEIKNGNKTMITRFSSWVYNIKPDLLQAKFFYERDSLESNNIKIRASIFQDLLRYERF